MREQTGTLPGRGEGPALALATTDERFGSDGPQKASIRGVAPKEAS